jgi:monoamine oxidase
LRYGPASRALVQCDRRFWRRPGRPWAFATYLPCGAFWDGNEEQRGRLGILSFLGGGLAAKELAMLMRQRGPSGVLKEVAWLGSPTGVLGARPVRWDRDPWAHGGYAYFDPSFDPRWRDVLAQPAGRVVFAGEHTSIRWQGYMNGAVESGLRAAAEILVLHTRP